MENTETHWSAAGNKLLICLQYKNQYIVKNWKTKGRGDNTFTTFATHASGRKRDGAIAVASSTKAPTSIKICPVKRNCCKIYQMKIAKYVLMPVDSHSQNSKFSSPVSGHNQTFFPFLQIVTFQSFLLHPITWNISAFNLQCYCYKSRCRN